MYEEVQVLTHSSIRIAGNQIIYFDPFHVEEETHDADIICVTHEHFDHYSPEDLAKVKNAATILGVMPTPMAELVMALMILGRMMSHRVVSAAQNRSIILITIHRKIWRR